VNDNRIPALRERIAGKRNAFRSVHHRESAGLVFRGSAETDAQMPNFNDAWNRGTEFAHRLRGTGGLDLDREIDSYLSDLTKIFNP
jgi:hypothetical protein